MALARAGGPASIAGVKTAIASVCLSGALDEKLEAIAAARFAGVEIFEADLLSYGGTPAEVRRRATELGLIVVAFQPFCDFEGMPEPMRSKALARAERKFDLMQALGCDLLIVCSNVSPDSLGGVERAAADFHALGERAAARGLRVGFEALAWGRHVNDYRHAWEVVRRADHPCVGLVLDSFHALARKSDLGPMRAIPKDRIFLVQLADAPLLELDYLSWSRHYRCFPGQGDLPVESFLEALQATGYDGPVSQEIFSDRYRAGSPGSVAIDGQRSLVFIFDRLRRRTGVPVAGLTDVPPRAACRGVEFVEFAMDEAAAADFTRLLTGLGFSKAGLHKSKDVTHWRQGDVNIVVNRSKEGFAHSFNVTHGSSVCAIGLRVDDASAAVDRAVALLGKPFRQGVGPGELEIPAIRGLGGSLIYLIDRTDAPAGIWDVDFDPAATETHEGAGLTRYDHISQSMHDEELLTWLLFYVSLLDVRKTPAQSLIDPRGIVQSQVVESADGALRLILNASQSQRTLASRFLTEMFGSGVQHIALATENIFATVERLRANGVDLLPIPDNYYDDLETRAGLPAHEIDRLRAGRILYDREGEAEYFQVYTRTLEGGFFFEIVERRDYAGYGAPNASIRLAAQTRLARHPAMPRA